jgi:hypothetical protein
MVSGVSAIAASTDAALTELDPTKCQFPPITIVLKEASDALLRVRDVFDLPTPRKSYRSVSSSGAARTVDRHLTSTIGLQSSKCRTPGSRIRNSQIGLDHLKTISTESPHS